jgi:hypothetical protein
MDWVMTQNGPREADREAPEIPAELAHVADQEGLSFANTVTVLEIGRIVQRQARNKSIDWRRLYESLRTFL